MVDEHRAELRVAVDRLRGAHRHAVGGAAVHARHGHVLDGAPCGVLVFKLDDLAVTRPLCPGALLHMRSKVVR